MTQQYQHRCHSDHAAPQVAGYGGALDSRKFQVGEEIRQLVEELGQRYPNALSRILKFDTRFPGGAWLMARQSSKGVKWMFVQAMYQGDEWLQWLFDAGHGWLIDKFNVLYIDGTESAVLEDVLQRVPGEFASTGRTSGHTDATAVRSALAQSREGQLALRMHDAIREKWPKDYERLFKTGASIRLLKWCIATAYTCQNGLSEEIHPRPYNDFIAPRFTTWANQANEPMMDLIIGAAKLNAAPAPRPMNSGSQPQGQPAPAQGYAGQAAPGAGAQAAYGGIVPVQGAVNMPGVTITYPATGAPEAQIQTVGNASSGMNPMVGVAVAVGVVVVGGIVWRWMVPRAPAPAAH